jgi:hypothetical protein
MPIEAHYSSWILNILQCEPPAEVEPVAKTKPLVEL